MTNYKTIDNQSIFLKTNSKQTDKLHYVSGIPIANKATTNKTHFRTIIIFMTLISNIIDIAMIINDVELLIRDKIR